MIAYGLWFAHKLGLLWGHGQNDLSDLKLSECWTFAALISATDPVSTLVLFAELRVEPHLFYLVFGESVGPALARSPQIAPRLLLSRSPQCARHLHGRC